MTVSLRTYLGLPLALVLALLLTATDGVFAQSRTASPYGPAYRSRATAAYPAGYVPKHVRLAAAEKAAPSAPDDTAPKSVVRSRVVESPKAVDRPEPIEEVVGAEAVVMDDRDSCDSCGACASCMASDLCDSCHLNPCCCGWPRLNWELMAGVTGFTGPTNRGGSGSFGFYEGVNLGMPLPLFPYLGGQVGYRAVQSNFGGGNFPGDTFTTDSRKQSFLTAGVFRRGPVGLQGGIVVDILSDNWYREVDLAALRGELSWAFGPQDIGFWYSTSTKSTRVASVLERSNNPFETWESTDLYAFFYRHQIGCDGAGDARLFAGWTGDGDGLLGADARLPLGDAWALEARATYLVPEEGAAAGLDGGAAQESWNVSLGMVWYPGRVFGRGSNQYRPKFPVADNGSFLIDRR